MPVLPYSSTVAPLTPAPLDAEYFCSVCNTPFVNAFPLDDQGVCAACRSGLQGFDSAMCFGSYEGSLRGLIHLFKYSGIKPLAAPLGRLLPGRVGLEIRAIVASGLRILDKIETVDYDVFRQRPILSALEWPRILIKAL